MRKLETKRILVSIPPAAYTQRQQLEGILTYAREKNGHPWQLQLDIGGFGRQKFSNGKEWGCDGIIAYIDDPQKRQAFALSDLPTVLIDPFHTPDDPAPQHPDRITIVNDHFGEGRTAAQHFLARHFEHFAYVDTAERTIWGLRRGEGFASELAAHGKPCIAYPELSPAARTSFAAELPLLVDWLVGLPEHTALFAAHDIRARQVIMAAAQAGIGIPDDVALLGLDNDAIMCETAVPALSSLDTESREQGVTAAQALDDLMTGRSAGRTIVTFHRRVVSRTSTDVTALDDPFVAKALCWARGHLAEDLSADRLAAKSGYSKRMLQIRAQKVLGITLGDEIRKMRLNAAAQLLADTKQSIAGIAENCGFANVSHLALRFAEAFGKTPREYRESLRPFSE